MNTSWLIAIDGSAASLKAVDHVIAEAGCRQTPPQIFLLNVQAPLSHDISRFVDAQVVADYHRDAGQAALAEARQKLAKTTLVYSAHVLIGKAATSIVAFAEEKACSQIVMGARGLGQVMGLILGSVATQVLHLSTLPVLLIK